ncbi:c-type cytochrome [Undibacterium sp. Di27W]|uniref:c-type cytochrome n=1 Tax=Undibacterium sp. Di27W TaxID=3413036 RepID=UPI003BF03A61
MKKTASKILLGLSAATVLIASTSVLAQQAPKPETLIKWRQSAYQVIGWNSGRIKSSLEGQYNKEEVIKAANTIAVLSNAGLGALFPAGTEQGKGWHDTAVKPELFKDGKHVGELAANFSKEANELAKLALAGDPVAVKDQYGKLTRTCKACHDDYKVSN